MKKLFITFFLVLLVPSLSLAVEFSPTKLKLTVPETIQYNFDGSALSIPVTVTGTPARTWFLVYTKDKAEDIVEVRNGYLGWHWVNQIDTCVYMSPPSDFGTGQQTITWNGKDSDGGVVPKDDYTYYMWAYDYENPPEANQACANNIGMWGYPYEGDNYIQQYDEDGLPLARPWFTDSPGMTSEEFWALKWTFGSDPLDQSLRETCDFQIPVEWRQHSGPPYAPNPHDFSMFYYSMGDMEQQQIRIRRCTWVPNDLAVLDETWGIESTECHHEVIAPLSDGNYLYWGTSNCLASEPCSKTYIMDFEAEIVAEWQNDLWILPDEYFHPTHPTTTLNAGPRWSAIQDSYLFQGTYFCLHGMTAPLRYLETEEYLDSQCFINQNGDFVLDRCTEPDHPTPWMNGGESAPYPGSIFPDANYFSVTSCRGMGAVSIAVLTPDGTAIGYEAFAGETGSSRNTFIIDNGSAFDGMYVRCAGSFPGGIEEMDKGKGLGFVAHDSIKGVIASKVLVADEAPSAFAVEQNSPNPANPTTTISFTLPETGNVAVDIFNVAGQKVDTLVNDFMDSGRHSVVWDGSSFSTGVYFYTVTSGEFSKTIKMTLLK